MSTLRTRTARNPFIDDEAHEDDGAENEHEDEDEEDDEDMFDDDDNLDETEFHHAAMTTTLSKRSAHDEDTDDSRAKRQRLHRPALQSRRYEDVVNMLHDKYINAPADPSLSPRGIVDQEEPEEIGSSNDGDLEDEDRLVGELPAPAPGEGELQAWSVPFTIHKDMYRHRDARWVTQRLRALMPLTEVQRVFPHPYNPRAVVLMAPFRLDWRPKKGVDALINLLPFEDRRHQRPSRSLPRPRVLWPAAPPAVVISDSSATASAQIASAVQSMPSEPALANESLRGDSPDAAESAAIVSQGAHGIMLGQPLRVSHRDYPLMTAAYERYERSLAREAEEERRRALLREHKEQNEERAAEGLSPLEALDLEPLLGLPWDLQEDVRKIRMDDKAAEWKRRLPCWVRMNHGRYTGDVGILMGVILRPQNGFERWAGVILLVPRMPEHPSQQETETYLTTTGKARSRFPRAHLNTSLAKRLFPADEYTVAKMTCAYLPTWDLFKFRRRPLKGDKSLVEWLAASNGKRTLSFAVRTSWITEPDRAFSECEKPLDGVILDFSPFCLRHRFDGPEERQRFDDMVQPRHFNPGWRITGGAASSRQQGAWDACAGDRVRVIAGELQGAIGVVQDVFADAGVADVRIQDPAAAPAKSSRLCGACLINDLDHQLVAGDAVAFTTLGVALQGLVVFVDMVPQGDGDHVLQLQRAHVLTRPDEPLVIVFSRTCRIIEMRDGTGVIAPPAPAIGDEQEACNTSTNDVRLVEDLHADLSKQVHVKFHDDEGAIPWVEVDGAPLRLKNRVAVTLGKLAGLWGIIRHIDSKTSCVTFERCGGDVLGQELVQVLASLCGPFTKERKSRHWLVGKRVACKTRGEAHRYMAVIRDVDETSQQVQVAWENVQRVSGGQVEWVPTRNILAVAAQQGERKDALLKDSVRFGTLHIAKGRATIRASASDAAIGSTPPGSPIQRTTTEGAWTLGPAPEEPQGASSTEWDTPGNLRVGASEDGLLIGNGYLLVSREFHNGLLDNKAKEKKVFVAVSCARVPQVTEIEMEPIPQGVMVSHALKGLDARGTVHQLWPGDVRVKRIEAGAGAIGVIVNGQWAGRVVKRNPDDPGIPHDKCTISVIRGSPSSQKRLRDYADVAQARYSR